MSLSAKNCCYFFSGANNSFWLHTPQILSLKPLDISKGQKIVVYGWNPRLQWLLDKSCFKGDNLN